MSTDEHREWPAPPAKLEPATTTHPTVVAGIAILAIIAMMTVFFCATIVVLGFWDPPTRSLSRSDGTMIVELRLLDYLGQYRGIAGLAVAMIATGIIWPAIIKAYKDETQ